MKFEKYLTVLARNDGSDLYLSTGAPPCAKFHGKLKPLEQEPLQPGVIQDIAYSVMDSEQTKEFEQELEMNLAYTIPVLVASVSIYSNSEMRFQSLHVISSQRSQRLMTWVYRKF